MIATSEETHGYYRSESALKALEDLRYRQTPSMFRTDEDNCRDMQRKVVETLENRRPDSAVKLIEGSQADCRNQSIVQLHYVEALFAMRGSLKAQHAVDQLLKKPPANRQLHGRVHFLAGVVSFDNGYPARAIKLLQKASELGDSNCDIFAQLGRATASLKQHKDAHRWYEKALSCQTRQAQVDPGVVVAAAYWNVQHKKYKRAKQLIDQTESLQLNSSQRSMINSLVRRISAGTKTRP